LKSVGEIHGEIYRLNEKLTYCNLEDLKIIQEKIRALKWVLKDERKDTT